MRNVYKVLAYLLAVEVVVQAMAIAYAIAGLGKWVADDGGVLNKQVIDSDSPDFPGVGGFATHGINGMMIIPLVVLLLLIVSFFAKIPGGVQKRRSCWVWSPSRSSSGSSRTASRSSSCCTC